MPDSKQLDCNAAIRFVESATSDEEYEEMCGSLKELGSFIKDITSEDILKKIIQQLLCAAECVHDERGVHENIKMENIFVTESKILIRSTAVFRTNKSWKKNVFEVCESILNAASKVDSKVKISDSTTAEHCRQLMKNKKPIENILRHPFFWDDEKKLAFICSVAQFVKGRIPHQKKVKNKLNELTKYEDWKKALRIERTEELEQYNEKYGTKGKKVAATAIEELADDGNKNNTYTSYDDDLSSLLNFIRNKHEHFWEQGMMVQACFRNDKTCGYWEFFTAHRFEKLLCDVYDVVNSKQFEIYKIFEKL